MMTIKVAQCELAKALGYVNHSGLTRFVEKHLDSIEESTGPLEKAKSRSGMTYLFDLEQSLYVCKIRSTAKWIVSDYQQQVAEVKKLFREKNRELAKLKSASSSIAEYARLTQTPVETMVSNDSGVLRVSQYVMSLSGLGAFICSQPILSSFLRKQRYMGRLQDIEKRVAKGPGSGRAHYLLTKDQWLNVSNTRKSENPNDGDRAVEVINRVFDEAAALASSLANPAQSELGLSTKKSDKQSKMVYSGKGNTDNDRTFMSVEVLASILGKPVNEISGKVESDYPISFGGDNADGYVTAGQAFAIMLQNNEAVAQAWGSIKEGAAVCASAGGNAHIDETRKKMSTLLSALSHDYGNNSIDTEAVRKYIASTIIAMGDKKHADPLARVLTAEIHTAHMGKHNTK